MEINIFIEFIFCDFYNWDLKFNLCENEKKLFNSS